MRYYGVKWGPGGGDLRQVREIVKISTLVKLIVANSVSKDQSVWVIAGFTTLALKLGMEVSDGAFQCALL